MNTESPPGFLNRTLRQLLTRPAFITSIEQLEERFRLIELTPCAAQADAWSPGMKLQIALGSVLSMRTYTPIEVDRQSGRLRILAYAHGSGLSKRWLDAAKCGDICHLFGPRRSLDLDGIQDHVVFIGDETSLGLSCAFATARPEVPAHHVFESDDVPGTMAVLDRLGLAATVLRRGTPSALQEIARMHCREGTHFVLTGLSSTIQELKRAMREWQLPARRVQTKAYWAPGKVGLD